MLSPAGLVIRRLLVLLVGHAEAVHVLPTIANLFTSGRCHLFYGIALATFAIAYFALSRSEFLFCRLAAS